MRLSKYVKDIEIDKEKRMLYSIRTRQYYVYPSDKKETIETLEYLKSKYELVILTDWYGDQQSKRLEKLDILKYFLKVYSAEKTKRKPFNESFMQAIGTNKPEECIMIGDNLERDIKGALNAGLQAIYYNPNHKEFDIECTDISKIEELRNIL